MLMLLRIIIKVCQCTKSYVVDRRVCFTKDKPETTFHVIIDKHLHRLVITEDFQKKNSQVSLPLRAKPHWLAPSRRLHR